MPVNPECQDHEICSQKILYSAVERQRESFSLTDEQYDLIRRGGRLIAFQWDVKDDQIRFSREWEEWFGEPVFIPNFEDYIQQAMAVHPGSRAEILRCMENIRKGMPYQKCELQLPLKNGEKQWVGVYVATQMDADGNPACGVGLLEDIMDQKEIVFHLEREIQMDTFTGLLNKNAIEIYGKRKLRELKHGETLTMLILDMDNFKNINDSYGHPCGDHVLKEVANLICQAAPKGSRAGRIGGDEFMVLLTGPESVQGAEQLAENLVRQIRYIQCKEIGMDISCSIGIASAQAGEAYSTLYDAADQALYQAKEQGKNRVCEYIQDQRDPKLL